MESPIFVFTTYVIIFLAGVVIPLFAIKKINDKNNNQIDRSLHLEDRINEDVLRNEIIERGRYIGYLF